MRKPDEIQEKSVTTLDTEDGSNLSRPNVRECLLVKID